jgi:hypothetical protein
VLDVERDSACFRVTFRPTTPRAALPVLLLKISFHVVGDRQVPPCTAATRLLASFPALDVRKVLTLHLTGVRAVPAPQVGHNLEADLTRDPEFSGLSHNTTRP